MTIFHTMSQGRNHPSGKVLVEGLSTRRKGWYSIMWEMANNQASQQAAVEQGEVASSARVDLGLWSSLLPANYSMAI